MAHIFSITTMNDMKETWTTFYFDNKQVRKRDFKAVL